MPESTLDRIRIGWMNLAAGSKSGPGVDRVQNIRFGTEHGNDLTIRLCINEGRWGMLLEDAYSDELERYGMPSLHFDIRRLVVDGDTRHFLRIECMNTVLNDIFTLFASAIIDSMIGGNGAIHAIGRSVERFHELLKRKSADRLTLEKELGLLGELLLLRDLVEHSPSALNTWVGPEGARHDFLGHNGFVEVKATRNRDLDKVAISSIEQLELVDQTPLHLAVMLMVEDPANGSSVPDLIALIREKGIDTGRFEELLLRAGIPLGPQVDVKFRSYRLEKRLVYRIAEGFPRITEASFGSEGIPVGVRNVSYTIDLSHAEEYLVDEETTESLIQDYCSEEEG